MALRGLRGRRRPRVAPLEEPAPVVVPTAKQMEVRVYCEGAPEQKITVRLTVRLAAQQASWESFVNQIRSRLVIDDLEGVYAEPKGSPVLCIKTLIDGGVYYARPTENCALVRSLTFDKHGKYPAWPLVEVGREAREHLERDLAEWPPEPKPEPETVGKAEAPTRGHGHELATAQGSPPAEEDDAGGGERGAAASPDLPSEHTQEQSGELVGQDAEGVGDGAKDGAGSEGSSGEQEGRHGSEQECAQEEKEEEEEEEWKEPVSWDTNKAAEYVDGLRDCLELVEVFEPVPKHWVIDEATVDFMQYRALQALALLKGWEAMAEVHQRQFLERQLSPVFAATRRMGANIRVCLCFTQFVTKIAYISEAHRLLVAQKGALDTAVHIAVEHSENVRHQRLMVAVVFDLVHEMPGLRNHIADKIIDSLARPILLHHTDRTDVVMYALWMLMEILEDPAHLDCVRADDEIVSAVQRAHTRNFCDEKVRYDANRVLVRITSTEHDQRHNHLSALTVTQNTREFGSALCAGRELGAL